MNVNSILSLLFIGFGFFILIMEVLGYEIGFRKFRISLKKGKTVWDSVNIQIMFLSAVVYAGGLASTSGMTFVEGFSWLRPGNAMAPLLGYMFGLPGCIGVGLGNLFADSFSGYYSWGSIGGFAGNFILAYIPHRVLSDNPLRRFKEILSYGLFVVLGSTLISAYIIVGLLDMIGSAGFMNPIPVIGGVAPPVQVLSGEALWNLLFRLVVTNNIPMNIIAGGLIIASFGYLAERGLFWKDRVGLFKSGKNRQKLIFFLVLGVAISYAIYNISVGLNVYGKIGRSENYLINIIGIVFILTGLLGFSVVSINAVKGRILSVLIGHRSVDARALEVLLAARREISRKDSLDQATGEQLGSLLFLKILHPHLAKLLRRLSVKAFVEDYLRYIMLYMMNSRCSIKKDLKNQSRQILIDECIVCKGVKSKEPACGLVVGFLKELTRTFAEVVKGEDLKVNAREIECKAMGKRLCKIELSWE